MKVLSLFDGMSCGMLALQRAGISVDAYYSCKIDKYAIKISKKNFPLIMQLGDVRAMAGRMFSEEYHIDLLIGGSPCQGFSFAGKQLNFEDPRSKLFFEYVRILKEVKPKYFLLENVRMKKEYQDVISEQLFGIQPITINSALVSAQNRRRLYRVGERQEDGSYKQVCIDQPIDKGILLKDILEDEVEEKYYLSDDIFEKLKKFESNARISDIEGKSYTLNTMQGGHRQPKILACAIRGRNIVDGKRVDELGAKTEQRIEIGNYKKAHTITSVQKDSMIIQRSHGFNKGGEHTEKCPTISSHARQQNNFVKSKTVRTTGRGSLPGDKHNRDCFYHEGRIRKLTPIECERLQTVPDNYTEGVSNSQRYKMLGNGWTVDVIAHILKYMK